MCGVIICIVFQVLQDWCYERAYSILSTPVKQAYQLGFVFDSKVRLCKIIL